MKSFISPTDAVAVLNRALAADKDAVRRLFDFRVMCNDEMADDPTIQVRKEGSGNFSVSLIGILNGIFGIKDDCYGYLASCYDLECPDGKLENHLTEEESKGLNVGDTCPKCETEIHLGPLTKFIETPSKDTEFRKKIAEVINSVSMENESNTPDFILAEFLAKSLDAFDATVLQRERWYGHHHSVGGSSTPATPYADGSRLPNMSDGGSGNTPDDNLCDDAPEGPPPSGAV